MITVLRDTLIIFVLILANGVFAMSEIAVVSARKSRLRQRADRGDARAETALALADDPNRFLSTIQIGITLIGVLAGAFGGVTIARQIAAAVEGVPLLAEYSQAIGLGVVVLATTYLTLVIGELVPKRIALNDPDAVSMIVAGPMHLLSRIGAPAVSFLSLSTGAVMRLLPITAPDEPPITEDELRVLLDLGTEAGVFEEEEQDIVERALRLDERRVQSIMTPRTQIVWLDVDDTPAEKLRTIIEAGRSRYPVCKGDLDNVLGIVRVRELFAQVVDGGEFDVESATDQPLFVVENMRALRVLELFREHRTHIALVLDEFGAIEGLVTMNDVLEAIVGDVAAVDEHVEPYAVPRDDGSWLLDGLLPIGEFREMFDAPELPLDEQGEYQTLAGFVVTRIGRIPSASDRFEWNGFTFEVVDMDGNRVDKVLMVPPERAATNSETEV